MRFFFQNFEDIKNAYAEGKAMRTKIAASLKKLFTC